METSYYNLDSQMHVAPDEHRGAVLLTILIKLYLALLLMLLYFCMAAF